MQSLRWYDHQKEMIRDIRQAGGLKTHSFLPFGAATFPLSQWKSNGVPTVRADGSPSGFGAKHIFSRPEIGFFVPAHECQGHTFNQVHLKGFRERFEPLHSHTGRGGGAALGDHRGRPSTLSVTSLSVAWDQPSPQRKVVASSLSRIPLTQIQSSTSLPAASSWHQLTRYPRPSTSESGR